MSEEIKTDDTVKEEIREKVAEGEKEKTAEFDSVEDQAASMGWHEGGKNAFGETVSAERFIQEKPLYNTIGKLKSTLSRIDTQVLELQSDNKKIAAASIKENERLLAQLAEKKDVALTNLESDEVRRLDKEMEGVREDIASAPTEDVSPYWGAFLEENEWASDEDDVRMLATQGIVGRYKSLHPDASDKELYDNLHKTIREKFPEKFETKKPAQKVGAANKRVTDSSVKKTKVTLADLDPDEARIARNIMEQLGKSEEEYMKTYSIEGIAR